MFHCLDLLHVVVIIPNCNVHGHVRGKLCIALVDVLRKFALRYIHNRVTDKCSFSKKFTEFVHVEILVSTKHFFSSLHGSKLLAFWMEQSDIFESVNVKTRILNYEKVIIIIKELQIIIWGESLVKVIVDHFKKLFCCV